MVDARDLVLALAVLVAAYAAFMAWPRRMVRVRSQLTGKEYLVRNEPGSAAVADRLAALELRVRDFLDRAEAYAPGDPRVANVRRRWDGTLSETPVDADVAYSLDKGSVSLCVRRSGGEGGLEAENTSMFVLLHELAHVASEAYGHTPEFWANARFLLELADATGSYAYEDFDGAAPVSYCGTRMRDSPLTCVKTKACPSALAATAASASVKISQRDTTA